jgi:hypothetical protein
MYLSIYLNILTYACVYHTQTHKHTHTNTHTHVFEKQKLAELGKKSQLFLGHHPRAPLAAAPYGWEKT